MKKLAVVAVLALVGFSAGLLSTGRSSKLFSRPGAQVPAGPARIVPLMAVYDNRSANPDGSDVFALTYVVAVRKDGSRAMISTEHVGDGWLRTRTVYNLASGVKVDIHDDLGIKTTWPGLGSEDEAITAPACPELAGSHTIEVLGHKAVQDSHFVDTAGGQLTILDCWRIPELGCLRALTAFRHRSKDGSYARNGEVRLVWLSEADPPDGFFEVSPELEEVSPVEEFQRFIKAGLFSQSTPVPDSAEEKDVVYAYWNGRIDRAQALRSLQGVGANQVPGQP